MTNDWNYEWWLLNGIMPFLTFLSVKNELFGEIPRNNGFDV